MPAHEVPLSHTLQLAHNELIRDKALRLSVDARGRVVCTCKSSRRVGVGRTARQALDAWVDKVQADADEGKGSE